MFSVCHGPIDDASLRASLVRPDAGALVVFEGWVRDHHHGRRVERLEYEVFEEMALSEGAAIVEEVRALFPGTEVSCVHRAGRLAIGEMAVWIGVTAPHRGLAFAGCRAVIERIKRRLPVWKKEHFPGAEPEWVDCTGEHNPALRREDYESRQARLPEVTLAGQRRLASSRVLVVGVGGLGCAAADALAGAGVGRIDLVDGGSVELSNLPRQTLFTAEDLGLNKACVAASRLGQRNPFIEVSGSPVDLAAADARARIAGHDVVLDCTDRFAVRYLLHDVCRELRIPLVQAAGIGFSGTVDTFMHDAAGCLHCLWPGRSAEELGVAGDCAGGAVFGPAIAAVGLMQATEALHILLGRTPLSATHTLLSDWRDYEVQTVRREAREGCPCCGALGTPPQETSDGAPVARAAAGAGSVSPGDDPWIRAAAVDPAWQFVLVDDSAPLAGAAAAFCLQARELSWPDLLALASARPTVLLCRHGIRSAELARRCRDAGALRVHALAGGTAALAKKNSPG